MLRPTFPCVAWSWAHCFSVYVPIALFGFLLLLTSSHIYTVSRQVQAEYTVAQLIHGSTCRDPVHAMTDTCRKQAQTAAQNLWNLQLRKIAERLIDDIVDFIPFGRFCAKREVCIPEIIEKMTDILGWWNLVRFLAFFVLFAATWQWISVTVWPAAVATRVFVTKVVKTATTMKEV